jgi:hypothetical protein
MTRKHEPTFRVSDAQGEQRLRELVLYVAQSCQSDPKFGATKLNKILWWSDFLAYAQYGKPITGLEYMRLGKGPVPKRLVPVRESMVENRELVITQVASLGGYTQQRPIALRSANLSLFTAEEISLVDRVINGLWKKTAAGVSNLSHGKAWEVVEDRGLIPYEAVFLSDASVNRYDVARTKELARALGWT